ncbi:MAG: diphosphate--fructose-6-phosphate 1-phosphotransferase [Calditrichia bacterium]
MSKTPKKLAILCGGGPAPGINSVIGAATIRAELEGVEVVGVQEGFKHIMRGDISQVKELNIENISRIHFRGGSFLGIARDNPTKKQETLEAAVTSLLRLNVDKLITIGGDDTAFSAMKIEEAANGRIHVIHVPKTIDNDLDLPHGIPTFGYQTARHVGVDIVQSLMVDAQTTKRWYLVVSMGRKAGHLALGIGKAAGATLTLIPEEFTSEKIRLHHIVDIIVGSIIKRLSYGRQNGVAVLAEGLVERLDPKDLQDLEQVEKDAHGHIRLAEVNFGEIVKSAVRNRLKDFGLEVTLVEKNIGYELRCADPIPFDMEYTRDLGFCAAQFILEGGNAAMVSVQNGHFVPLYFKDILDPVTNKTKVRMVDINSESYFIARRYMLRLNRYDIEDPHTMAKYAAVCATGTSKFEKEFRYLIEDDHMYQKEIANSIQAGASESNEAFEKPLKKKEKSGK